MSQKITIDVVLNSDGTATVHSSDRNSPVSVPQSELGKLVDPSADIAKFLNKFAATATAAIQQAANVGTAVGATAGAAAGAATSSRMQQAAVQGTAASVFSQIAQQLPGSGYAIQQPAAANAGGNGPQQPQAGGGAGSSQPPNWNSPAATGAFPSPQNQQPQPNQPPPQQNWLQRGAMLLHSFRAGQGIGATATNPTVGGLANSAASAVTLNSLGAAAVTAGAAGAAFGLLASAANRLVGAFDDAIDRLSEYGPQSSAAQANAELRQVTGDVRRAQLLDQRMAEFVDLQSEGGQILQDMKAILMSASLDVIVPLLRQILDVLKFWFDLMKEAAKEVRPFGDFMLAIIDWMKPLLERTGAPGQVLLFFAGLQRALNKYLDEQNTDPGLGIDLLFPNLPGFALPNGTVPFRSPVDFPRR